MAKPDTKIDPDAQAPSPETPATDAEGSDPLASVHASIASLGEQMLAGFQSLGGALADMKDRQDGQQEQIDQLASAPAGQPVKVQKRQVSRDTVRFRSTSRQHRLWLEPLEHNMIGGRVVRSGGKLAEFTNHIYDVDATDEKTLAQIRNHAQFGKRIFEDPTARPVSGVTVQDGPKSTGRVPTPKPPGELVATL